jgi:O-antigen ligase
LEHGWFYLVIWMFIMMALIMSHSRAGFLSTVLSLLVLSLVLSRAKGVKIKYALLLCGLSLAMIGFLFFFSGDALDVRFGKLFSSNIQRPAVYQVILDYLGDHQWIGTGYGTFGEAFQSIRAPDIKGFFLMAHNTYLENAMEMGLPAAISMFGIFAGFLYLTYSGVRVRRRSVIYPCIGFSATILVALHSLVDFSLQIPAVAITYSFIIGAACSQSWSLTSPKDKW